MRRTLWQLVGGACLRGTCGRPHSGWGFRESFLPGNPMRAASRGPPREAAGIRGPAPGRSGPFSRFSLAVGCCLRHGVPSSLKERRLPLPAFREGRQKKAIVAGSTRLSVRDAVGMTSHGMACALRPVGRHRSLAGSAAAPGGTAPHACGRRGVPFACFVPCPRPWRAFARHRQEPGSGRRVPLCPSPDGVRVLLRPCEGRRRA